MKQIVITVSLACLFLVSSCKSQKEVTNSTPSVENRESMDQKRPNGQRGGAEGQRKGPPNIDDVFKMDTNNDGKISMTEAKGRLKEKFSEIDSDKDGLISREEFQNAPRPQRRGGRN